MKHLFIKGDSPEKTIVLFHGTGGDEEDLIPIGQRIDAQANILSLRGNVNENGMNRFFKRLAEGVFDEEDLIIRAQEVMDFLKSASEEYGFSLDHLVGIGYSNGANMIAAIYYLHGSIFEKSILFHPMVPLKKTPDTTLNHTAIFIGAGENDPIVPFENTIELNKTLQYMGANVSLYPYNHGHTLTSNEVNDAATWYNR